jgi:transcriptional regulator with XRE-family HTH domain
MNAKSIKKRLLKDSVKDLEWKKEAEFRIDNQEWLDLSFSIAVKILSYMKVNNVNQKDLSKRLNVSPQYVSKLLKGKQPLGLPAVCKMQKILQIKLLEVPKDYSNITQPVCNVVIKKESSAVQFKQIEIHYQDSKETYYNIWKQTTSRADC